MLLKKTLITFNYKKHIFLFSKIYETRNQVLFFSPITFDKIKLDNKIKSKKCSKQINRR